MSEMGNNQVKAALVLATGGSVQEAAEKAGVTERTVYNWRSFDPAFMLTIAKMQGAVVENEYKALSSIFANAVNVLRIIKDDPTARTIDKVNAAKVLLETATKFEDPLPYEGRLSALEDQVAYLKKGNKNGK